MRAARGREACPSRVHNLDTWHHLTKPQKAARLHERAEGYCATGVTQVLNCLTVSDNVRHFKNAEVTVSVLRQPEAKFSHLKVHLCRRLHCVCRTTAYCLYQRRAGAT
jgi:hypothetical protein